MYACSEQDNVVSKIIRFFFNFVSFKHKYLLMIYVLKALIAYFGKYMCAYFQSGLTLFWYIRKLNSKTIEFLSTLTDIKI